MAANKGSVASEADARFSRLLVRVDSGLPEGLRQPLLEYLGHLVHERGLAEGTVQSLVHTNRGLCRLLAKQGEESFARLRVNQLDQLVSLLVTAPPDDVLRVYSIYKNAWRAPNAEFRGSRRGSGGP